MPYRLSLLLVLVLLTACLPTIPSTPAATIPPTPAAAPATGVPQSTAPAATAQTEAPSLTPAATAEPQRDELAVIAAARPQPRDQTALVEAFTGQDVPEVARTRPLDVQVGDVETFWVTDSLNNSNYQVQARLRYSGPVALMYVDLELDDEIAQQDIERSAQRFEQEIYPRNRELFGEERSPGIDGDPRLTILNTNVRGAGGYFSSADGVTKAVNRFSNEREMFVIGVDSYPIGGDGYASTLAHEFQHMIEWNVAQRSPSWFNEGMSTLAEDLYGFDDPGQVRMHLQEPDIQLTSWSSDAGQTGRHYGTSRLFLRYIYNQYGDDGFIRDLIKADAGNNVDAFVALARRTRPDITSFADIVADWAVANALNAPEVGDGRYAYSQLPETIEPAPAKRAERATVAQFGADYLRLPEGPVALRFDGADTAELVGELPQNGRYAWWSNQGDDSVQTLTRAFDLGAVSSATLQFQTWYEIERNYDYAFVSASTDGGTTWTTLQGLTTTDEDPQGQNLGDGLTGVSGRPDVEIDEGVDGRWVDERFDLSAFAGKQILLRFWLVSDIALNGPGMLIDNIRIPEIGYSDDVEQGDGGWQAVGFVRTTGELPQQWTLRLIREGPGGVAVEPVASDPSGRAGVVLANGERGTLVVMASTPFTTEAAAYAYAMEQR